MTHPQSPRPATHKTPPPSPGATARRDNTLRGRVSKVLTGLLLLVITIATLGWMHETRRAIHEEINAASRVAEQWVGVLVAETLRDREQGPDRLMAYLTAVGRLRANRLEVLDATGRLIYVSPEPTYKAGRFAPEWFARQLTPEVPTHIFDAGDRQIVLRPDASRSVLDAWDYFATGMGWAFAAMLLVGLAVRLALDRALAPLAQINSALDRGAAGLFDTRLPTYGAAELDRLADSYNRLADNLDQSRALNLRLEEDQAFARALQLRLEEERRFIARELHDELGQGITAVRAIAGAMMQRCEQLPQLHGSAQAILAMTDQMQDGVRTILHRLRSAAAGASLDQVLRDYCALWSGLHPEIELQCEIDPIGSPTDETTSLALLRLLQESLTNVARHARASRAEVRFRTEGDMLVLRVSDNGRGLAGPDGERDMANRFGITGMRERVAALRGSLTIDAAPAGGLSVSASLPKHRNQTEFQHGADT
ncbi:sensor histidine kinase [Thauera sp. 2A1]|uniref:sensor histidine kinase n=1 Tax=Thauera sp. 2A1 TaxID=2570191 RepID=UPI0012921027|nr:sensor histidine kinase [Thauera sp. 2A1]KAI5916833.1 sensor histidine kinase [Thauera sp. 2A1]